MSEIKETNDCWVIKNAPTADVVEVVHGEWEVYGLMNPQCSLCRGYNIEKSRFCPNCGAKMDGKDIDVTTKTDRVEVVRCGQCKHATEDIIVEGVCYCHKIQQGIFVDEFCNYGERRNTK